MSQSSSPSLPYPAEKLVPHRAPMLLVRQLLERKENFALVDAVVPRDCIFLDEEYGILPELYMEFIAQATAAVSGWDALQENKPVKSGFLVGVNNVEFVGKVKLDETVAISIKKTFEFGDVTIMEGMIHDKDDKLIVKGEIRVWEDNN